VPFFKPIIQELERRGYSIVLTARDAFQVCELAERSGLKYAKIGRHYGKNKLAKGAGLFFRAAQLLPLIQREKPIVGISHGSRSQIILGNLLRIPTVLLEDYEFAQFPPPMRPTWKIAPDAISDAALQCDSGRIRKYSGIKEDVYVPAFKPDPAFLQQLGLSGGEILVTVRPPATEAHYHCQESEVLFEETMKSLHGQTNARVVLLPRNQKQAAWIKDRWPEWFADARVIIPRGPLDGLDLLWHSDLVVSGGGTMNARPLPWEFRFIVYFAEESGLWIAASPNRDALFCLKASMTCKTRSSYRGDIETASRTRNRIMCWTRSSPTSKLLSG